MPAPAPIDALFAWPLVLMDRWVGGAGALAEIIAAIVGIAFTWLWYVVLARVLLGWFARRMP